MGTRARDDEEATDLRTFHPSCGPVVGVVDGPVVRAWAIPYAHADRFAAPERVAPWTAPLCNDEPAPACPQLPSPLVAAMLGGPPTALVADEDCQRLTITRPSVENDSPLPVMVWVHGGSYVLGAGDEPHHDPTVLVAEQNVIVVAVTFRLGVLGFLGDGSAQRPANLGLLDLIAALDWVHENIEAFGGDPGQVTCVGQSAGADAVSHLMAVPNATRRFRRAILQSAPFGIRWNRSAMVSGMFAHTAGFDAHTSLRDMLATQQKLIVDGPRHGLTGAMPFGVQYGMEPLPAESDVEEAWAATASDIDLLVGCNRDEIEFFVPGVPIAETASHFPSWVDRSDAWSRRRSPARCIRRRLRTLPANTLRRVGTSWTTGCTGMRRVIHSGPRTVSNCHCCSASKSSGRERNCSRVRRGSRSRRPDACCVTSGADFCAAWTSASVSPARLDRCCGIGGCPRDRWTTGARPPVTMSAGQQ